MGFGKQELHTDRSDHSVSLSVACFFLTSQFPFPICLYPLACSASLSKKNVGTSAHLHPALGGSRQPCSWA